MNEPVSRLSSVVPLVDVFFMCRYKGPCLLFRASFSRSAEPRPNAERDGATPFPAAGVRSSRVRP